MSTPVSSVQSPALAITPAPIEQVWLGRSIAWLPKSFFSTKPWMIASGTFIVAGFTPLIICNTTSCSLDAFTVSISLLAIGSLGLTLIALNIHKICSYWNRASIDLNIANYSTNQGEDEIELGIVIDPDIQQIIDEELHNLASLSLQRDPSRPGSPHSTATAVSVFSLGGSLTSLDENV